ncbi:hypothetical protein K501DRAFT_194089 [Backusella circina FSU 941]|nr:hypothetical protein K501DRAFT_194089 [Backusella circina FSU 941]
MNTKVFLTAVALICLIVAVNAQTTTNPVVASLQTKASSIAAAATNTEASNPSSAMSLKSGFSNTQLTLYSIAIVAVTLFFA